MMMKSYSIIIFLILFYAFGYSNTPLMEPSNGNYSFIQKNIFLNDSISNIIIKSKTDLTFKNIIENQILTKIDRKNNSKKNISNQNIDHKELVDILSVFFKAYFTKQEINALHTFVESSVFDKIGSFEALNEVIKYGDTTPYNDKEIETLKTFVSSTAWNKVNSIEFLQQGLNSVLKNIKNDELNKLYKSAN